MSRPNSAPVEGMLDTARDALAKDMLGLSVGLCSELRQRGVADFEVLALLARSYDQLGMREAAKQAARDALRLSPDAADMLSLVSAPSVGQAEPPAPGFVVIKAWGCGFWSDVAHVLGCLLICELTGRIPVTDWGDNSLFTNGSGEDAFRLFFEPLSPYTAKDLIRGGGAIFPKTWEAWGLAAATPSWQGGRECRSPLYFLNRPEEIVVCDFHAAVSELAPHLPASHPMAGQPIIEIYRYLAAKYLVPRADIQAQATAFFATHIAGSKSVAVHLRGSDKKIEFNALDQLNSALLDAAGALGPAWRVFVLTDDQGWIEHAVRRFGDRVVFAPQHRSRSHVGVHLMSPPTADPAWGEILGREVLTDCCIALACDRFIGAAVSNVSAMIDVMKPWPQDASLLLGWNILEETHFDTYAWALSRLSSAEP